MDRRSFLTCLSALAAGSPLLLSGCAESQSRPSAARTQSDSLRHVAPVGRAELDLPHAVDASVSPIDTPPSAWKERLSADVYYILFEEGTERPGSSPLLEEKRRGTFTCAACHLPLFPSTTKYESGTGWPSFWAPIPGHLDTKVDRKLAMERTEYHCRRCSGHQGHVFSDGPDPTGLRYCNNGDGLRFVPASEALPALRA